MVLIIVAFLILIIVILSAFIEVKLHELRMSSVRRRIIKEKIHECFDKLGYGEVCYASNIGGTELKKLAKDPRTRKNLVVEAAQERDDVEVFFVASGSRKQILIRKIRPTERRMYEPFTSS